jgi:hypothetical protein
MTNKNTSNENNDTRPNGAVNAIPSSEPGSSSGSTLVGAETPSTKGWSSDRSSDTTDITLPNVSIDSEASPKLITGAVKLAKPHSRTAVGQLTQDIQRMPSLYVSNVLVEGGMGKSWEPVNSRKLRLEAVDKWLDKTGINFEHKRFTHIGASQGVVRVILLLPGQQYEDAAKIRFKSASKEPLDGVRRTIKTERGTEEHNIRCRLQESKQNSKDSNDVYTKAFNFILRDILAREDFLESIPLADGTSNCIESMLRGCSRTSGSLVPSDYRLNLRIQPSVNVTQQQLLMNVDIVPCIPNKPLYEVVLDLVGQSGVTVVNMEKVAEWLPSVTHSLRGLKVRCGYVPGKRTRVGREKATILGPANLHQGRAFCIRDIKMPGDHAVTEFDVDGKRGTVYDHFEKGKLISS